MSESFKTQILRVNETHSSSNSRSYDIVGANTSMMSDLTIEAYTRSTLSAEFTSASTALKGTNIVTNIDIYNKRTSSGVIVSGTSQAESAYAVFITTAANADVTAFPLAVREAMTTMINITSSLYKGILETCKSIITSTDFDDSLDRDLAVDRLSEALKPFHSVLAQVFFGLLDWSKDEPVAISFLLTDVLPHVNGVDAETQLSIITSVMNNSRASIRFAALQALDNIGSRSALKIMKDAYPNESKLAKDLIAASLQVS